MKKLIKKTFKWLKYKKNNKKEISIIKNDKNDEYSKTIEIINKKKNQVLEHLINYHANNHATEKLNYHDNKHRNRQEHVIHIISIMFNKIDNNNVCPFILFRSWDQRILQQQKLQTSL